MNSIVCAVSTLLFLCMIMSVSNTDRTDAVIIKQLREQYEYSKETCTFLRKNIADYKQQINDLQKSIKSANSELRKIRDNNESLQAKVQNYQNDKVLQRPVVVRKKWSNLKDPGTKFRRRRLYKKIVDQSIRNITECTHAKLSLAFDTDIVDIVWSENEMKSLRQSVGLNVNNYSFYRRKRKVGRPRTAQVVHPVKRLSHFQCKAGIFNDKCKYSESHIRKVVSVMDDNRISQEAYQSLRNVCMGHMPSLNDIKKEKKEMSVHLPVTGDPSVSTNQVMSLNVLIMK